MKKIKNIYFTFVLFIISIISANAQTATEIAESVKLERQAIENYKAKDFANFLQNVEKARKLRPNHSRLIYNSAIAFALNNQTSNAFGLLEKLANMGLYFEIETDEDFKSLYQNKRFKNIQHKLNKNKNPVNKSRKAFSLSDKSLITESVGFDSKTERFFISSVHQRKIIVIDKDGNQREFSNLTDGLWSVLGIKIDEKRRILWACSSAFPQMINYDKNDEGKAGIFKYNLDNGKLIKKYLLENTNEKHALGDLVINKKGDVFATDSISPRIYKIDLVEDKLELFLENKNFNSLQGLAFSDNEQSLFVADYSTGIHKIDLDKKQSFQIIPEKNITLLGIDGLYFYKNKLIAIQNGIRPQRVVQFSLNKDQTRIEKFKTLEANHDNFEEPTLGVIIKNEFYYVANSQWNLTTNDGKLLEDKLKEPVILKLSL